MPEMRQAGSRQAVLGLPGLSGVQDGFSFRIAYIQPTLLLTSKIDQGFSCFIWETANNITERFLT